MTTLASNVRSVLLSASEAGLPQKLRRDFILFQQQQDAIGVFLIEEGLIKLIRTSHDGSKLIHSVAGPHQLIGEECLADDSAYSTTAACLTDVVGSYIPLSQLRRVLTVPETASALLTHLVERNRELVRKIEMLTLRDVEHRILNGLATVAALVAPNSDGVTFDIPMTQSELASFVGATRETTSTTLGVLRNRKLLTLSRGLVTTVHPDILISAANDRLARTV